MTYTLDNELEKNRSLQQKVEAKIARRQQSIYTVHLIRMMKRYRKAGDTHLLDGYSHSCTRFTPIAWDCLKAPAWMERPEWMDEQSVEMLNNLFRKTGKTRAAGFSPDKKYISTDPERADIKLLRHGHVEVTEEQYERIFEGEHLMTVLFASADTEELQPFAPATD